MAFKMRGFSAFTKNGDDDKKKKEGDEFGLIKKGQYPNIIEEVSRVQKDDKGLFTTGVHDKGSIHTIGPHFVSDTTRYPQGFQDYKGIIKEGDYIDETTYDAWSGVNVEGDEGKATGKRKVYNPKTKKYEDYKK